MRIYLAVWMLALVGVFAQGPAFADDRGIRAWFLDPAVQGQLAAESKAWERRAEQDGTVAVIRAIIGEVEQLRALGTAEPTDRAAIERFLDLATHTLADCSREAVDAVLGVAGPSLEPDRLQRDIDQALGDCQPADLRETFKVNLRRRAPGGVDVSDVAGRDPLFFVPDDTSEVSKQLVGYGYHIQAVTKASQVPLMLGVQEAVTAARGRWDDFMQNVVHDQFIWETMFNGWLGRRFGILAGTLSEPPTTQLRILHPLPLVAYSDSGGASYTPRIGVEVIGLRRLDAGRQYQPSWGVSLLAVLPAEAQDETEYGLLVSLNRFSFGAYERKRPGRDDDAALIVGVELADLFQNGEDRLRQAVEERLDELEQQVRAKLPNLVD